MIRRALTMLAVTAMVTSVEAKTRDLSPPSATLDARVRDAYLFAFPLYEFLRVRQGLVGTPSAPGKLGVNKLGHRRVLTDAATRTVTTPNNDTLYSLAYLDLANAPVSLTVPATGTRYVSVALTDPFADHVAILHGDDHARTYWIAGPNWRGTPPPNTALIRMPSNDASLGIRTLVSGQADLPAACAVQDGFVLDGGVARVRPLLQSATAVPDGRAFLAAVNELLGRGPIAAVHRTTLARLAAVGIRPGDADAWSNLPATVRAAWEQMLHDIPATLKTGLIATGYLRNGWAYPRRGIGHFGADDLYRSRIALTGLGALPVEEAMYVSASADASGTALDGRMGYILHLPPHVPVKAFWSLSLYQADRDGRLFFFANPANRYAIGDRSDGLVRSADGGIDILIAATPPLEPSNWLPAPRGPFTLTFRAYLPMPALLKGNWRLPPLRRLDGR